MEGFTNHPIAENYTTLTPKFKTTPCDPWLTHFITRLHSHIVKNNP